MFSADLFLYFSPKTEHRKYKASFFFCFNFYSTVSAFDPETMKK